MNHPDSPIDNPADNPKQWYVLRFLYRDQPRIRALFRQNGIETFTPTKPVVTLRHGRRIVMHVPVIWDLLFVHSTREELDPYVRAYPNLQYKYKLGGRYCEPIVVPENQMRDFMAAIASSPNPLYFAPDEIDLAKGMRVRIIGGALDGLECTLLKVKGARSRRLIVGIPDTLIAAIEVQPDFIEVIK